MPVISILNQKGGVGKSTLSCHLAYWLNEQGKKVAVIDSDAQQSVSRWLQAMNSPIPFWVMNDPDSLINQIPALKVEYDYVIVDGSGGLTETTRAILLRSDTTIVPVQPTGLDLSSATDALKLVAQAQSVRGGPPQSFIALNRVVKGTRLFTEASQFLAGKGLLKSVIYQRQAIADCFGQESVIWSLPKAKGVEESAQEFDSMCREIMEVAG